MEGIRKWHWSIASVCLVLGFMVTVQFRSIEDIKADVSHQRNEELAARLVSIEKERDDLRFELEKMRKEGMINVVADEDMRLRAGAAPLIGEGIVVHIDDSTKSAKAGENTNLYVIHDDDLLRVINELRAAGAEAISINGQRLIANSEVRCAGPTLSVNNVRLSAPYEVNAIGEKKNLENAINMRGGVAETLKVWGMKIEVEKKDDIYIPAYRGTVKHNYAEETQPREEYEK